MRISYAYDIPLPSRFAAAIQILNTCHGLARLGAEVRVYCGSLGDGGVEGCLEFYGLEPHENLRIIPTPADRLPAALARLAEDGPADRPHAIVSRGEPGLALFRALRRPGRRAGSRWVYEAHRPCYGRLGEPARARGPLRRWIASAQAGRVRRLERATVEGVDGLVCLTQGVRDALGLAFRIRCPTLILPSGTTVDGPTPARGDGPRDIDVLYVGKLERRKGVQVAIEAMRFLPGRVLWVVGGSPAEVADFATLAAAEGVGDRVRFTGYVEPTRVREFLGRARVGICPLPTGISAVSETFTSPLKILEMMAAGVPVVAGDVPSAREILTHGRQALLVPPDDPRALAGSIRSLLDDPALAARLSAAAREHVEGYSWENRARRLLEFLEGLAPTAEAAGHRPEALPL